MRGGVEHVWGLKEKGLIGCLFHEPEFEPMVQTIPADIPESNDPWALLLHGLFISPGPPKISAVVVVGGILTVAIFIRFSLFPFFCTRQSAHIASSRLLMGEDTVDGS